MNSKLQYLEHKNRKEFVGLPRFNSGISQKHADSYQEVEQTVLRVLSPDGREILCIERTSMHRPRLVH